MSIINFTLAVRNWSVQVNVFRIPLIFLKASEDDQKGGMKYRYLLKSHDFKILKPKHLKLILVTKVQRHDSGHGALNNKRRSDHLNDFIISFDTKHVCWFCWEEQQVPLSYDTCSRFFRKKVDLVFSQDDCGTISHP